MKKIFTFRADLLFILILILYILFFIVTMKQAAHYPGVGFRELYMGPH